MKIITETDLTTFKFWAGAKDFSELLTYTELKEITDQLEELYPDGLTDTQINDLFWFDEDFISELIGVDTETIFNR